MQFIYFFSPMEIEISNPYHHSKIISALRPPPHPTQNKK